MSLWGDQSGGVSTWNGAFCTTVWRYKEKSVYLAALFVDPVVDGKLLNHIKLYKE